MVVLPLPLGKKDRFKVSGAALRAQRPEVLGQGEECPGQKHAQQQGEEEQVRRIAHAIPAGAGGDRGQGVAHLQMDDHAVYPPPVQQGGNQIHQ